jgi:NADH-quinone oxidoreductase subunit L
MIQLIVFLPLAGGDHRGPRRPRDRQHGAKLITTGALFVSCALSWPIFLGFMPARESQLHPVLPGSTRATSRSIGRCASTR